MIQKNELLEMQSTTDVLTGIRNRRAIMEELETRINQALVNRSPLSIVLFDIDYFKKINDDNGHQYGDIVLNIVATTISELIREIDSVGRYGGEEFLVVLPNTEQSKAIAIAERIREAVEHLDFSQKAHVTISGGVAVLGEETLVELIDKADKKLYEAKKDGRNRIKA
ncbi:Response regulator PleD [anaerobic digester metagenome]